MKNYTYTPRPTFVSAALAHRLASEGIGGDRVATIAVNWVAAFDHEIPAGVAARDYIRLVLSLYEQWSGRRWWLDSPRAGAVAMQLSIGRRVAECLRVGYSIGTLRDDGLPDPVDQGNTVSVDSVDPYTGHRVCGWINADYFGPLATS